MAENGETRDPSSHRTPSQVKRLARGYNHRPEQIKKRVQRDQARRKLMKEGKVRKGDGKDVNHKNPLRSGGSNARANLNVESQAKNRAWNKKSKKS
jgi:5-methylcytosine-specific restriction endonuclease McrA